MDKWNYKRYQWFLDSKLAGKSSNSNWDSCGAMVLDFKDKCPFIVRSKGFRRSRKDSIQYFLESFYVRPTVTFYFRSAEINWGFPYPIEWNQLRDPDQVFQNRRLVYMAARWSWNCLFVFDRLLYTNESRTSNSSRDSPSKAHYLLHQGYEVLSTYAIMRNKRLRSRSSTDTEYKPRHSEFTQIAIIIIFMLVVALTAFFYGNYLIVLIIIAIWIT